MVFHNRIDGKDYPGRVHRVFNEDGDIKIEMRGDDIVTISRINNFTYD